MVAEGRDNQLISRRQLLRYAALGLAALGGGSLACGPQGSAPAAPAAQPTTAAKSVLAPTVEPAKPAAAAPASPKAAGPLKVANNASLNNMNGVPYFVGVEKGLWLDHGIDAKLKVFNAAAEMTKAISANEVEFIGNASSNLLPGIEQGLPLMAIGATVGDATRKGYDDDFTITARPDSGISSIQDLVGKKIATNLGGSTDEYLKAVLAKNGIQNSQVEALSVTPGNTPNALKTSQVDAAVLREPYGTIVLDTIPGSTLVVRGGNYLSYVSFLVTRPDVIQNDPDLVQRYVDGWAKTSQWVRQQPDEAGEITVRWIRDLEAPIAKKALKFNLFDPRISKLTLEAVAEHNKELVEQKKLKAPVDISKFMDLRFLNKTMETYPQYFSDLKPAELVR